MADEKIVIEVVNVCFGVNAPKTVIVDISIYSESGQGSGIIKVWIPAKDSASELKQDALRAAKHLMEAAVLNIPAPIDARLNIQSVE